MHMIDRYKKDWRDIFLWGYESGLKEDICVCVCAYIYKYVCVCVCVCVYIYICLYRERDRERSVCAFHKPFFFSQCIYV